MASLQCFRAAKQIATESASCHKPASKKTQKGSPFKTSPNHTPQIMGVFSTCCIKNRGGNSLSEESQRLNHNLDIKLSVLRATSTLSVRTQTKLLGAHVVPNDPWSPRRAFTTKAKPTVCTLVRQGLLVKLSLLKQTPRPARWPVDPRPPMSSFV